MMLTIQEENKIAYDAQIELSRRFFTDYLELTHHGNYRHFRHTRLISEYLQRIADGEQLDLLIEMPPRHRYRDWETR